MLLYVTAII